MLKTTVLDNNNVIAQSSEKVIVKNNQQTRKRFENSYRQSASLERQKRPVFIQAECPRGRPAGSKNRRNRPADGTCGSLRLTANKGLILNGTPYHLYGVCRHQEWEGFGSALTDEQHEKDIELILELGANGVRLAHYQQAEKMYSLCDEKGLVVWAEIPNTPTYRAENPAYLQNCKEQLDGTYQTKLQSPLDFLLGNV